MQEYSKGESGIDVLTGVLNRSALEESVSHMISDGKMHAFILFDFDGFKQINDTLGHEYGDSLLVSLASSLRTGLKSDDIIGRTASDEFFMCISDISDVISAERIAKHVCVIARQSFLNGMITSASLGVVINTDAGADFETIYKKASIAMKCAKRNGGNGFAVYSEDENCENRYIGVYNNSREGYSYDSNMLITYDCQSRRYFYKKNWSYPVDENIWLHMASNDIISEENALKIQNKIDEISTSNEDVVYFTEVVIKNEKRIPRWVRIGFIFTLASGKINITITDVNDEVMSNLYFEWVANYDGLTGLMNRKKFCNFVDNELCQSSFTSGKYAIIYFDILRFKAINEMFGRAEGDRLLIYIADSIQRLLGENDAGCRIGSDRFIVFTDTKDRTPELFIEQLRNEIRKYDITFEIAFNAGIYIAEDKEMAPGAMIDRAILAQSSIKGSYTVRYNYYKDSLRSDMLSEQEIVGMMASAINDEQFVIYYQPQYNHSNGMLMGAEALVRWDHPEKGLISPGIFIPIFEKNGFITKLDLYVFAHVCAFIRKCIDNNLPLIPVSSNFSRHDIFQNNFVEKLEEIRRKYDVPVKYLRVEITESAIVGSSERTNEIIKQLHNCGYVVEMDDFGSGYSSLNVLKDIELDIIKLDMRFLSKGDESNRGGTILSSVVRMAKWLNMPVIAEGVETVVQADYLRSIGCDCIQGYLYSKPLPEDQYTAKLDSGFVGAEVPQMNLIETLNACDFWSPKSQETLIFSNYVGGAAIFDYCNGKLELLRVNKKYLQEIGMNLSEKELIETDPFKFFDEGSKEIYIDMIERAIVSNEEEECETWRTITSDCCGSEKMCLRTTVRKIGEKNDDYIFYAVIRNITDEKMKMNEIQDNEKRFKMVSEQVNVYFWEYNIMTKEMRPCFRCMRDLGLPPLVTNYPAPLIGNVFPEDYAEMYYEWMDQLAKGITGQEAIIPLTEDRIPFRVKYTTEFDENGHPVKAFGSATLVVE